MHKIVDLLLVIFYYIYGLVLFKCSFKEINLIHLLKYIIILKFK